MEQSKSSPAARPADVPIQAQVISNPFPEATPPVVSPASAETIVQAQPTGGNEGMPMPSGAGDGDLIEKVWVDATDKIIAQFSDDPYALQEQQAQLTRDYLQKRFGINIGAS